MGLFDMFKKKRDPDRLSEDQRTDDMQKDEPVSVDPCEEDEVTLTVDEAVESLRKQIIAALTKHPAAVEYQLSSLLWQDAASCFPERGFSWDGAWFKLDLKTGKLLAKVSTYPNQFGVSHEDMFSLTASEFGRIAKQYGMRPELRAFKSDEDWEKLFDDDLKAAVASACAILQKQEEERRNAEIKRYAVKIPANYANSSPDMDLAEIDIETRQMYSSRSIRIVRENGKYHLTHVMTSNTSPRSDRYSGSLSAVGAAWLEDRVENTIKDPDGTTWRSLVGGDTMNIVIRRDKGEDISLRGVGPIRKYSDLLNELANLARYGYSIDGDDAFESGAFLKETVSIPKSRPSPGKTNDTKGQEISSKPQNDDQAPNEHVKKPEYTWYVCASGNTTDKDDILKMISDCGVRFTDISMKESHDIGDRDWYTGQFSGIEELLADKIHRKYLCEWDAYGIYDGVKILVHFKGWNIFGGVHIRYEKQDAMVVDTLLRAFEQRFCRGQE